MQEFHKQTVVAQKGRILLRIVFSYSFCHSVNACERAKNRNKLCENKSSRERKNNSDCALSFVEALWESRFARAKERKVQKCYSDGGRDSIKTYSLKSKRHYLIKMLAKAKETTLRLMVQIPWHITQASGIVHTQKTINQSISHLFIFKQKSTFA